MIADRHVELIHAELDGELTPEERAELSRVLLANPEARALRDQLSRLFGELAKVESAPPPAGLTTSVLSAVGLPDPSPQDQVFPGAWWRTPAALRYAAVFVGGLAVGAAAFQLGKQGADGLDVSQLVGTIGGQDAAVRQTPVDRIQLELDQVSGAINSWQVGSQLVLELDLQAREPVEIVASHGAQTVRFSLGSRPDAAPERLLWLPDDDGAPGSAIGLKVFSAGRLLHEGVLEAPAR
jgi:hypothetical protein